uniref:Uncharacterized protein n=1 Tax=Oryza glumipatula TaxID=40148 RepID=A0A0E0B093_9ORYZ
MPGERSTHLARCNARYAARRDKPCAESFALECLDGCNPSLLNLTTCLQTIGDVPATSTLQFEVDMDSFVKDKTDDQYYFLCDDEDAQMVESDDEDKQAPTSSIPDKFNYVYSNIPRSTNVLNPQLLTLETLIFLFQW